MTIQDLGSIGELIAALATLATLVYLATQVKQAKREFYESSQRARTEFTIGVGDRSASLQLDWFSPEGRNQTMMKGLLTDERLTPEEAFEFSIQMSIFMSALMQSEQLHKQGLLDPEFLETRRSIYLPYLAMPRVRRWWTRTGKQIYSHTEAFDLINQMIEEIEPNDNARSSTDASVDH